MILYQDEYSLPLEPGATRALVEFGMQRVTGIHVRAEIPDDIVVAADIVDVPPTGSYPNQAFPNVAELILPRLRIESREDVPLLVTTRGDAPQLLRFLLEIRHEDEVATIAYRAIGDVCPDVQPHLERIELPGKPEQHLLTAWEYLQEMEAVLRASPNNAMTKCLWHFFDLDRETNDMLIGPYLGAGSATRRAAIKLVAPWVMDQCARRARNLPSEQPCPQRWEAVEMLLEMWTQTIVGNLGADLALFEEAFEQFANGDLRFRLRDGQWTTQPSSGLFFLFGELALAGAEFGKTADRADWERIANATVRAQEIFTAAYAPKHRPNRAVYRDYGACFYSSAQRLVPSEIAAIRKRYTACKDATAIGQKAGHNAREAMPGLLDPPPGDPNPPAARGWDLVVERRGVPVSEHPRRETGPSRPHD